MARNYYGPLRDAHQQALDATDNRAEQTEQPTRPEGHYQEARSWSADGGMVQQQASAVEWAKANHHARQNAETRQEAREALDEHVDQAKTDQSQENAVDPTRGQEGQTQQRQLKFFEDKERSEEKTNQKEAAQDQSKTQGEGRTLSFFEDRNQSQDQDLSR